MLVGILRSGFTLAVILKMAAMQSIGHDRHAACPGFQRALKPFAGLARKPLTLDHGPGFSMGA